MPMRIISRAGMLLGLAFAAGLALSSTARAETEHVVARDNVFTAQEVHIDKGDRVLWKNVGPFNQHTITADDRSFNSGRINREDEFAHTFKKQGYYFYHCTLHGQSRTGMWGVVVVGNPEPPGGRRSRLVVPDDFSTIQKAVNRAEPGSTIVVRPGVYRREVVVDVPDLVIKGVDRFRTILDGGDAREDGITVEGFSDVTIKNLTVRNFTGSGISLNDASGYTVADVDLIMNGTNGVNAVASHDGVIKRSFGWGSGDSAFRVADCSSCSTLVNSIKGHRNFVGLMLENTTGVVVRASRFTRNGVGIVSMTSPDAPEGPNLGVHILGNAVANNNYSTIPEAGLSTRYGLPWGTGIWLAGAANNVVENNDVDRNDEFGILVTRSFDLGTLSRSNRMENNSVGSSGLDLAWDGYGDDDCFEGNLITGATGPPAIQSTYACGARPFTGIPYDPVASEVTAALVHDPQRGQQEPPDPRRPRCQRC